MKTLKRAVAVLLVLCMVFSLTACGMRGQTVKDAVHYVKAVLDLLSKGSYDQHVNIVGLDNYEEQIKRSVAEAVEAIAASMGADINLNDGVRDAMYDVFKAMSSKAQYTVGTPEKVDDGFDVPVTIVPISMSEEMDTVLTEAVEKGTAELLGDPDLPNMTEEDVVNRLMLAVASAMKEEIEDNPTYGDPVVETVRYKELEEGIWGVDAADGEKLVAAMFKMD